MRAKADDEIMQGARDGMIRIVRDEFLAVRDLEGNGRRASEGSKVSGARL